MGVLASGARQILPEFFTAAAKAVSEYMSKEDIKTGSLMPEVTDLREVSLKVAHAVGTEAIRKGVSRPCALSNFQHDNDPTRLHELIRKMRWEPDYLPLVPM